MKCPHCTTSSHKDESEAVLRDENQIELPDGTNSYSGRWLAVSQRCPECGKTIIWLYRQSQYRPVHRFLAYPKGYARPIPVEVVDPYRQDFLEACLVLDPSPKASAALSRRCLQAILRDKAATKSKDLHDQIEEVIASGKLPSHIQDDLHAVRNIGNIAAHTMKSTTTGAIVDVAPGEAEWNLDVLESLFDFYFVQPAISAKRKAELNKKLKDAGKPEIP